MHIKKAVLKCKMSLESNVENFKVLSLLEAKKVFLKRQKTKFTVILKNHTCQYIPAQYDGL